MSNWKHIFGVINLSFLLMDWIIAPFIPFYVPDLGIRAGGMVFFGCFILTMGFGVFLIFRKLKLKITPIYRPEDPGCAIYFFLIVGWILCFMGIATSWTINTIEISILALIFWLGHIISWMFLWNSIKKIEGNGH